MKTVTKTSEWKTVPLGEVSLSQKGKKPARLYTEEKEGALPYVDIEAFEQGNLKQFTDSKNVVFCDEGDLVMVWDGARSGLVGHTPKGVVGSTLVKIKVPLLAKDFLYYFLLSKYLTINTRGRGTGTPHVDPGLLWSFDLPILGEKTQQKLVAKLEELLSELDAAIAEMKKVQGQIETYRQAVLKSAFEGKLNEFSKDSFENSLISKMGVVTGGLTKNSKRNSLKKKLPYLRVANVYANSLDLNEIHEIGITEKELERVLLKKGDLLIVEGNGSPDQIGRVAIWDGSIENCVHQNHLIKVRCFEGNDPKYVLYWLLSPRGREEIKKVASSTSGLYTLSIIKIENLHIPTTTPDNQFEIIKEIEARLTTADVIRRSIQAALDKAEELRQSILKKAFEGSLVEQDPNDEPAEKLLERIKEERERLQREMKQVRRKVKAIK